MWPRIRRRATTDRLGEKTFRVRVVSAGALDFRHGEIGVHAAAGTGKTRRHSLSRREYAFAHVGGTLATLITEALERNARDVQAQVDAIDQRDSQRQAHSWSPRDRPPRLNQTPGLR
jgi:hypothetical protein